MGNSLLGDLPTPQRGRTDHAPSRARRPLVDPRRRPARPRSAPARPPHGRAVHGPADGPRAARAHRRRPPAQRLPALAVGDRTGGAAHLAVPRDLRWPPAHGVRDHPQSLKEDHPPPHASQARRGPLRGGPWGWPPRGGPPPPLFGPFSPPFWGGGGAAGARAPGGSPAPALGWCLS